MRVALLHHGSTRTDKSRVTFSFSQPAPDGTILHEVTEPDGNKHIVRLDVGALAVAMRLSIRDWFQALQGPEPGQQKARTFVEANLPSLANVKPISPAVATSATVYWAVTST
jgi:hypothetical protein